MGLSGMSIGSLVLIFLIVVVLFGTKKLRNIGTDMGSAVRGFKKGLAQEDSVDTVEGDSGDVAQNATAQNQAAQNQDQKTRGPESTADQSKS